MVKCAWFRQYLLRPFRLQNSVCEVHTKAISSNVAGKDVDDPWFISTDWDRKISRFSLILLLFDCLFGSESGTETSIALELHQDCVFEAPARRKAA